MHSCQRDGKVCPVHEAKAYASTTLYLLIITNNYTKPEIAVIQLRTGQLMLDRPSERGRLLDDLEPDILDKAAQAGQYFAKEVREYLSMTYGTIETGMTE